jgi:Xaa-Pro aminopeptidase
MEQDLTVVARKLADPSNVDHARQVDMGKLRRYRLARTQEQLQKRDYGAALLYNPINIRYATGSRNMQVWTMHNAARYAFVPASGKPVLFDYRNSEHLSEGLETVGEVRRGKNWYWFAVGSNLESRVDAWADEINDLMHSSCGSNRRLAVDNLNYEGVSALLARGISVFNGQEPLEHARAIKSEEEIFCQSYSVAVCETALYKLEQAIEPGVTENQLWSILNAVNTKFGGEYIETKLLSAGGRTNPWYQECSNRIVRPGDLVSLDTDMIGPYGYDADISRTFFCEPGEPTGSQKTLYKMAYDQIHHNMALLRPGLSFREFSERSWVVPDRFREQAATSTIHGVGMRNEYPMIGPPEDFQKWGYDGQFQENMTVCVESYIGEKNGTEGVKLEQMVLITREGIQLLSTYPFDGRLKP